MPSVHNVLSQLQRILLPATENALRESEAILCHVLSWDRLKLFMEGACELELQQISRANAIAAERATGVPLQYLLGHAGFMGLDFLVRPGVLIPRGDTERLVEVALKFLNGLDPKDFADSRIPMADLGTGSGAIVLSLAHYFPDLRAVGVDLSEKALEVAAENLRALGLEDRVTLKHLDMFQYLESLDDGALALVVSNPPYIPTGVIESLQTEVREHEPRLALDGGEDGLSPYRRLAVMAHRPLMRGGRIAVEIGYDQAAAVQQFLLDAGAWEKVECLRDLQGNDRVVTALKR